MSRTETISELRIQLLKVRIKIWHQKLIKKWIKVKAYFKCGIPFTIKHRVRWKHWKNLARLIERKSNGSV